MKVFELSEEEKPYGNLEDSVASVRLDRCIKAILHDRRFLSRVLRYALPETEGMTDQEVYTALVPTEDAWGRTIPREEERVGLSGKEIPGSGSRLDVFCALRVGEEKAEMPILINIESQNRFSRFLVERALYYASLLIQDQGGRYVFPGRGNVGYGGLLKVWEIWINTKPPKYIQNTIKLFELRPKDVYGSYEVERSHYDKIGILMVNLGEEREEMKNSLLGFLDLVFSETLDGRTKLARLKEEKGFWFSSEARKEVEGMSGYAEGIFMDGVMTKLLADVRSIMETLGLTAEKALDLLKATEEEREYCLAELAQGQ